MKVAKWNSYQGVLSCSSREEWRPSFCFDIELIPTDKRSPKYFVVERLTWRYRKTWRMSWKKFLRQKTVGHMALIDKKEFTFNQEVL